MAFTADADRPTRYTVTTWHGEPMADALAAAAHAGRHPRSPINELAVEELEQPSSADLGALPPGEIVNPNEWR